MESLGRVFVSEFYAAHKNGGEAAPSAINLSRVPFALKGDVVAGAAP